MSMVFIMFMMFIGANGRVKIPPTVEVSRKEICFLPQDYLNLNFGQILHLVHQKFTKFDFLLTHVTQLHAWNKIQ